MVDSVKRSGKQDKNQAKIASAVDWFKAESDKWLSGDPTGNLTLSVEFSANQGGIRGVDTECKERGRV
jgi:hypothetical protein